MDLVCNRALFKHIAAGPIGRSHAVSYYPVLTVIFALAFIRKVEMETRAEVLIEVLLPVWRVLPCLLRGFAYF